MEDVSVIREPYSERTAVLADKNTNVDIVNISQRLRGKVHSEYTDDHYMRGF